ncbi:MAG: hypothetical protein PVJ67_06780 [Candidatus Pacearchaeota archaeon]|jgi:hypothetical protein
MEEKTSHEKEHKEHKTKSNKNNLTDHMRKNPWILSTLVLGVVVLILLVGNFGGAQGTKSVTESDAGQIILDFANTQVDGAELVGVEEENGLYKVTLSIEERDVPVYLTMNGENLVSGLTPLSLLQQQTNSQTQTATAVPKTDKPIVELFIWGYCPYGVQAQGPLAEVAKLLRDSADFKAVLYYDGHGAFETQENKIQECIQEIAPDKYWDYASGFATDIYPKCGSERTEECDKTAAVTLMDSLGIDSDAVLTCVDEKGEELLSAASARASSLGVTGSPSLVINGVKVNSARTAEAYKTAICEAFTEGNAPSECSTKLDDTAQAAAGNC